MLSKDPDVDATISRRRDPAVAGSGMDIRSTINAADVFSRNIIFIPLACFWEEHITRAVPLSVGQS